MIRGMVDRLATRLKQNGDDVEGWLRLVRAYMVMGERDKAMSALSDARQAFANDAERLKPAERRPEESRAGRMRRDAESVKRFSETWPQKIRHDAQATAFDHDRRIARGARGRRRAGAERDARLHRVLLDADDGGREADSAGQALPARRPGAAGLAGARRQSGGDVSASPTAARPCRSPTRASCPICSAKGRALSPKARSMRPACSRPTPCWPSMTRPTCPRTSPTP